MKEWWDNLNLREKQTLTAGSILIFSILLYLIVWMPISHYNQSQREKIAYNQKLLAWMQTANQHIQTADSILHPKSAVKNSAALLSLLQKEINQSSLKDYLVQMNQAENNAVQITLQKVNFDVLMEWLISLWKKYGITVTQMTATPEGITGSVNTTLVIK